MSSRYANASRLAGRSTGAPAAAAPMTPGKATLVDWLAARTGDAPW